MSIKNLPESSLSGLTPQTSNALTSADVTSTTGSPTITTSGIYTIYTYTGSGTIVLARSGYCDFLMAAGGSGGTSGATNGSGRVLLPTIELASGTLTVTVGAGGPGGGNVDAISGFASVLGALTTGRTGALAGPAANMPGYTSSITGTSITYGTGLVTTPTANRGEGGTNVGNTAGSSGVVIVRVVT